MAADGAMDALGPLGEFVLRGEIGLVPILVGWGGGEADEGIEWLGRFIGWVGLMNDEICA